MIQILYNDDIKDFEFWSQYVNNHQNGTVFQSPELYLTYKEIPKFYPYIFIAYDDDDIVGVLMAVCQKEFHGLLGQFTHRSIIMGGPLADNPHIAYELIHFYNKTISNKVIYSEFRNLFNSQSFEKSFFDNGYTYEPHLDIHIDLTKEKEEIIKAVSKNKRGNISKSTNKGTVFSEVKDEFQFLQCVELIQSTYKRIALPCPPTSFFQTFWSNLFANGILKVFSALNNGKIVGTRMELCYRNVVYDWYAGADDGAKSFYPNDFLPYNILLWGKDNDFTIFDFGGAGKPDVPYGVRDHKMKFGGELVEFGRYNAIHKPLMMIAGKFGLKVYKFIKKRL